MKKLFQFIAICFLLLFAEVDLLAQLSLPAIFGDNMVLQQQTNAAIWGNATANAIVSVRTSWNNRTVTARADR